MIRKALRPLFLLTLLLISTPLSAQDVAYESYELPNGMTVIPYSVSPRFHLNTFGPGRPNINS